MSERNAKVHVSAGIPGLVAVAWRLLSLAALLHRPCARHRSAEWVAARQAQEEAGGAVPGGCTMAVGSCTALRRVASLMRATQSLPA